MTGDQLSDYPCSHHDDPGLVWEDLCTGDICYLGSKCSALPIYRAHIALRKAVLGDMTPEEAAAFYRTVARSLAVNGRSGRVRHINALADVVEGL